MRRVAILGLVAAFLASGAHAWWCTGHMVIAEIARQNLNSGIGERVDAQFQWLNQWFPQTDNMISGACWADDLKSQGLEDMEGWHFINQPYNPDNVPIHPWPIQTENVQTNIMQLGDTLKKRPTQWIKAFATANLVHFYGDIHQPLHATELFDETFPNGDYGGNLFKVQYGGQEWRLHFIWDSVCGQYQTEPKRPLSQSDYDWIKNLANQYQANFSIPESAKKEWNSTIFALESLEYAIYYAYDNHTITPGQTLTDAYIQTCKVVAGYRLAAAGYRLASDLNYLFKDDSDLTAERAHAVLSRIREMKKVHKRAVLDHAANKFGMGKH